MRHRRCISGRQSRSSRPGRFGSALMVRQGFKRQAAPVFPPGLELLKLSLLNRALRIFCEAQFERPLRRAADKAARLALTTGYPLLVFPELFAELAISGMLESEHFYHVARRSMAA